MASRSTGNVEVVCEQKSSQVDMPACPPAFLEIGCKSTGKSSRSTFKIFFQKFAGTLTKGK